MEKPVGNYFLKQTALIPVEEFENIDFTEGIIIYELIRMMDGKLLFFRDHLERLKLSHPRKGEIFPFNADLLLKSINKLAAVNHIHNGNVKLTLKAGTSDWCLFFIPTHYPEKEKYEKGVGLGILEAVRKNPNAKTWNPDIRILADNKIRDNKCFEVLLLNESGNITEGSRSNIFFVKDKGIVTPPNNEILPGITRKHVIQTIRELKIPLEERTVCRKELTQFSAAFLTGTSLHVLPVKKIENTTYDFDSPIIKSIGTSYLKHIDQIAD